MCTLTEIACGSGEDTLLHAPSVLAAEAGYPAEGGVADGLRALALHASCVSSSGFCRFHVGDPAALLAVLGGSSNSVRLGVARGPKHSGKRGDAGDAGEAGEAGEAADPAGRSDCVRVRRAGGQYFA